MAHDNPPDRHFERRRKAALGGKHLPNVEELLRGMAFHSDNAAKDAYAFAARLSAFIRRKQLAGYEPLLAALDDLELYASRDAVQRVDRQLEVLEQDVLIPVRESRRRCTIYLAIGGDEAAAAVVASEIAALALRDLESGGKPELMWRALGWAVQAYRLREQQSSTFRISYPGNHQEMEIAGHALAWQQAFDKAQPSNMPLPAESQDMPTKHGKSPLEPGRKNETAVGVVVFPKIGNVTTNSGKEVAKEFGQLVGKALPLPTLPDLSRVRAKLVFEFPHAVPVLDAVLNGFGGHRQAWIHPTILVGPPGSGKSRFAVRLAEELGLSFETFPCGGVADSMFGGTSRNWNTGSPSVAVSAVRSHGTAGPLVVLDEFDKVGNGRHNGALHDVLQGLLERETARRWHDPYVQHSCDLSHLSWIMTVNAVEPIPKSLRDRCRCIRFPPPGPEHLAVLAQHLMAEKYREKGLDPHWATPLDGIEIKALSAAWPGGSIRALQRIVERLIAVREVSMTRC
jgi:hypothetical protein